MKLIAYIGSKERIYPMLGKNLDCIRTSKTYVEPFGGGFSLGLTLLDKGEIKNAVYNELNESIYNVMYCCKNHAQEVLFYYPIVYDYLHKHIDRYTDKIQIEEILADFKLNNAVDRKVIRAIMQLMFQQSKNSKYNTDTINLNRVSFSIDDKIEKGAILLQNVTLHNVQYGEVLKRYNSENTFWFIDPPYDYASTLNKQYYGVHDFNQIELYQNIKKLSGSWLMTNTPTNKIKILYNQYEAQTKVIPSSLGEYLEYWVIA